MSKLFIHAESVPKLTAGQAVTALRGREFITNDEPLLIHNADSAFHAAPGGSEQRKRKYSTGRCS